jgi:hypothetical protein
MMAEANARSFDADPYEPQNLHSPHEVLALMDERDRIEAMARNLCRIAGIDYEAAFHLADKPTVLTAEEIEHARTLLGAEGA